MNMKPCPFCGKEPTIAPFHYQTKHTRHVDTIPQDATILRTMTNPRFTTYYFQEKAYIPQCSDPNCLGRIRKAFRSPDEAVEAWNRRA